MSLSKPNPCMKCNDNCTCDRLAIAIETASYYIADRYIATRERNFELNCHIQSLDAKNLLLMRENKSLKMKLETQSFQIASMRDHIMRFAEEYEKQVSLNKYVKLLESFIQKRNTDWFKCLTCCAKDKDEKKN